MKSNISLFLCGLKSFEQNLLFRSCKHAVQAPGIEQPKIVCVLVRFTYHEMVHSSVFFHVDILQHNLAIQVFLDFASEQSLYSVTQKY